MSELATGIFVGRAIKSDPSVGQASESTTYVCVLLEGKDDRPGVTLCEQPDLDALMRDFRQLTDDIVLLERLGRIRMIFDAPSGTHAVARTAAVMRYERLDAVQIGRFLLVWE